jgi:hypothetical protein
MKRLAWAVINITLKLLDMVDPDEKFLMRDLILLIALIALIGFAIG